MCYSHRGDLEAIERVAYELCEMQAREGAIYTELHYPPHYLLPESFHSGPAANVYHTSNGPSGYGNGYKWDSTIQSDQFRLLPHGHRQTPAVKREMTIRDVVDAVNRGLAQGQRDFKVTIRSVLTLIRTKPQWSADIVNVAIETRQHGVVGIDMIGDVFGITSAPNEGTSQNG